MLVNSRDIKIIHKNERDVEIPALLNSVQKILPKISSLLDVGAHYTSYYYAKELKQILGKRIYDGVDILPPDPNTNEIVNYFTGNVLNLDLPSYDYVSCISTLEHCGLSTYKQNKHKIEQLLIFSRLVQLANMGLFISVPFGSDFIYEDQYSNITIEVLNIFDRIANLGGFIVSERQFFFTEFAQGGHPFNEISLQEAFIVQGIKEKGVQCVCITEWKRIAA